MRRKKQRRAKMLGIITFMSIVIVAVVLIGKGFVGKYLGKTDVFEGMVLSVNEQGMEVESMNKRTLADGSIVGETGMGNSTKEIFFGDNTKVIINNMVRQEDGSVTFDGVAGSISDIDVLSSVKVQGKSDSGKYVADIIEVWVNVN